MDLNSIELYMTSKLVELYVREILAGNITIENVPARLRQAVEEELERIKNGENSDTITE